MTLKKFRNNINAFVAKFDNSFWSICAPKFYRIHAKLGHKYKANGNETDVVKGFMGNFA